MSDVQTQLPGEMSGKVLDGSALLALAAGEIDAASWLAVAWDLGLTFIVPAPARAEALLAEPDRATTVERILRETVMVVRDDLTVEERAAISARRGSDGVFDPVASWIVGTCADRSWSALTSDDVRLRRLDPDVAIEPL